MTKAPDQKIADWFEKPVKHLQDTYGGDAGFIPLALSFALAERLLTVLIAKDGKCKKTDLPEYLHKILGVDLTIAEVFWAMYRDGMMHCAQPYNGKIKGERDLGWDISDTHDALPKKIENEQQGKFIALNPWKWFYHVVQKYSEYPEVVELTDLRNLGEIRVIPERQTEISRNQDFIHKPPEVHTPQMQTGICYPQKP